MPQKNKPSRRERERQRQRQEMLAAALELFSRKGYHNVAMNEIAEKAEFAVGTLYKFFKNKEDLYQSIMTEQADWFHAAMLQSLEVDGDEITKLRSYVSTKGALVNEKAAVVRLYHTEIRRATCNVRTEFYSQIRQKFSDLREGLAEVFASGIQRGIFRRIAEPLQLAVALESLCSGFILLWLEDSESNAYPDDPDVILNIIFKGLIID